MNYVGMKCPVCGKAFTAEDDIVVCPECGAPYHRACYAKAGKCIFADKHGPSYAWSPPAEGDNGAGAAAAGGAEGRTKRCPRCGALNSAQALFCERCGQPLSGPEGGAVPPYGPGPAGGYPPGGFPGGPSAFPRGPANYPDPNETIGDIPAGEMARFVQNNAQYYLPVFLNLKRFGKNRFNFCAFLFPGAWMLYRKLYKVGTVVTAVMFGLHIAYAWISQRLLLPIYQSLLLQSGMSGDTLTPSNEQIEKLAGLISSLPGYQIFLIMIPYIIFLVQLVLMLVFGFSGNRMYLKHCVERISAIRKETSRPPEAAVRMQEEGGVNVSIAVCLGICYLILSYLPSIL